MEPLGAEGDDFGYRGGYPDLPRPQRMSELNDEDQNIPGTFNSGNIKRSTNAVQIQMGHQQIAGAILRKRKRINIRSSSKDRRGLQKNALAEGILSISSLPASFTNTLRAACMIKG